MSWWNEAVDAVSQLGGQYLEYEKVKAQQGLEAQIAEQNAILNRPDSVTQRPNAQPSMPSNPTTVTSGSGGGAGTSTINFGGVQLNRTAVYVAGAALGVAVLLKMTS